ncbi:response regulator transcription factor [Nocardioides sp. GXQ0305]|uniref:response regulator transcription factor n=1 Tax=Nocardioides sp. GXQ0305 TaxID=3423912 RepID=UPI003D7F0E59
MAGSNLDAHDVAELGRLLTLVGEPDGPALPWPFARRLKDLIGCDDLTFVGQDSGARAAYFEQSIEDTEWFESHPVPDTPDEPAFWHHYWACEACSYPEASADYTSVVTVSDFYSTRQWHSTGMYVDYLGPLGIEHELMMCLPDGPARSVRLICYRGPGRDFGDRERLLLRLLRPHVAEAYRATARRGQGAAALTPRQLQVLELVRDGHTNRQIGRRMRLSEGTVRTHLNNIFERLEVTSRTAAVARALDRPPVA